MKCDAHSIRGQYFRKKMYLHTVGLHQQPTEILKNQQGTVLSVEQEMSQSVTVCCCSTVSHHVPTACGLTGAPAKESKGNTLEVKDEKVEKSVVTEETLAGEPEVVVEEGEEETQEETADAPAEKGEGEEVEEDKTTEKAEEQKVRCPLHCTTSLGDEEQGWL